MFHAIGILGKYDLFFRPDDGRGGFEKNEGFLGHLVAEFGGVRSVIAPDADDLAGFARRQEPNVL
jgi:hypothetical protein